VRTHLKRVFHKTNVHSQTALVALIRGFVTPYK
jgi:DNA-binding CsgD family transcriptional regulator